MKEFVKKILVAINGTDESIKAAMYAIMLAKSSNWKLKFIYIVDSATIKYLGINQILIKEEEVQFKDDLVNEGNNYLDYVSSLAAVKGLEAETELLEGNVSSEIVKAAEKYEADMIVIGGQKRQQSVRTLSKNVLSNHRTEVLLKSKCPVLVINGDDIEPKFKIF